MDHSYHIHIYNIVTFSSTFEIHLTRVQEVLERIEDSGLMRQSACQVLGSIMVYSYDFLFNCTTVGQASDSMRALM